MNRNSDKPSPSGPPDDSTPTDHAGYFEVGVVGRTMAALDETTSVGFEAVVELDGSLDEKALRSAWDSLLARHPILSCRRRGDEWQPANPDEDNSPVALSAEPRPGGYRLTLHCDHVAFDGLGSVILLRDLRTAYLAAQEGSQAPTAADWSPRNFEEVAGRDDIAADMAAATRAAFRWRRARISTHRDPAPSVPQPPSTDHALLELGPVLQELSPFRRRFKWSTDALLLSVLEKAWESVFGAAPAETTWMVAQDLRPDLRLKRGIGNLSIISSVVVKGPGIDMIATTDSLSSQMRAERPDLVRGALFAARHSSVSTAFAPAVLSKGRKLRSFRSLSNVGQLGTSLDDWGAAQVRKIYFVGPMAHPPYTSFIAAGRGESTLVSVRTSPDWLTKENAADLEAAAQASASTFSMTESSMS